MSPIDKPVRDQRTILRAIEDKIDAQICEMKRLSTTVYGDPQAGIEGLVGDNKKHKEYIEGDKKFKWSFAAILSAIILFKENIFKLFH